MNIINILKQSYDNFKLAHLYQIKCNTSQSTEELNLWMEKLLQSFSSSLNQNHPDVLWIEKKSSQYVLEDFAPIYKFNSYKKLNAKRKFIVITSADELKDLHINKLLKIFEEPQEDTTIFLLNSSGKEMLSTIESRSIGLRVTLEKKSGPSVDIGELRQTSYHDFSQKLKNDPKLETQITQTLFSSHTPINWDELSRFKTYTERLELDNLYHNPPLYRYFKLYKLIQLWPAQ